MSDEVDSFSAHCLAFVDAATCQIWWKFVNNFYKNYSKKIIGLTF